MSDKIRWRYGDTNPVVAAVKPETLIEIGDLLYQDVNNAKPAADVDAAGRSNYGVEAFKSQFLGVAMQRSRGGEDVPIRVATTGVFEFDCAPSTFELGDLIEPVVTAPDSPDSRLCNQQVTRSGARNRAIGRVAKRQPIASTSVLVDIRSTVMTGGV